MVNKITTPTTPLGLVSKTNEIIDALGDKQDSSTAVTHTASTAVGSATQPVYIASNGVATATTYSLAKSVPSDAVFTDTTYSVFTGANGTSAGTAGLVKAPAATDNTKFLKGDGTWASVDALPSQSGNSGKYLTTNGTSASWATITIPSKISDLTDDTATYPVDKADTLTGLTASISELNIMDGVTVTASDINSVTSKISLSSLSIDSGSSNYLGYDNTTGKFSAKVDTTVTSSSTNLVTSGAVDTAIANAIVGGVVYKGTWAITTSTTSFSGITLPVKKGYLYYVTGTGPATVDSIEWNPGDYLLVNADVASGGSLSGKVEKIDNTEAADIVRTNATQTLTNKTIDADDNTIADLATSNFKSGVIVTSVGSTGADTSIATEKAVRSAITSATSGMVTASSTTTFTNKTFDANGTGNSISNLETADFASGVLQTTVRAKASASDSALASEKAIATALEGKQDTTTAVTHTASTAVGSATQPVYIASDGTATATTYALNKTVPSDAVFTDTTYSAFTGATSGAAGTSGLVPAPSSGETSKYLKSDGTWGTPAGTTYSDFVGADGTDAGTAGLVPAPAATDNTKFLKGDGTWATPSGSSYTASDGITLTGTNFTNSGVRSISTGATNGTISVNTNGTSAEVSVYGLGTAAYTNVSSMYSPTGTAPVNGTAVASAIANKSSVTFRVWS